MNNRNTQTVLKRLEFKNREELRHLVKNEIEKSRVDEGYFSIIEIVGWGGIGKSRLLEMIREENATTLYPLYIGYTFFSAETPLWGTLKTLRNRLNVDLLEFDEAYEAHCRLRGIYHSPNEHISIWDKDETGQFLDQTRFLTGILIPMSFLITQYRKALRWFYKRWKYGKDVFIENAKALNEQERSSEILADILARDLRLNCNGPQDRFLFLYDAYERQPLKAVVEQAPVFKKFLKTLGCGVHIITSREKLDWTDFKDNLGANSSYIVKEISSLPDEDCKALFRDCVAQHTPQKIEQLAAVSHCIPMLIHMLCEIGFDDEGINDLTSELHSEKEAERIIARFLLHIPDADRYVVELISAIQFFDEPFFNALLTRLGIATKNLDFAKMGEMFFVETIDDRELYKTHDILTEFMRESIGAQSRYILGLEQAVLVLHTHIKSDNVSLKKLSILFGILHTAARMDHGSTQFQENVISLVYTFYDAGWWPEIFYGFNQIAIMQSENRFVLQLAEFFSALCTRRMYDSAAALERLDQLSKNGGITSQYLTKLIDLEKAYLLELTGRYEEARGWFSQRIIEIKRFDPLNRFHFRVYLYQADLLTMEGDFSDADMILQEVLNQHGYLDHENWLEAKRQRGHALRLGFQLDLALQEYNDALSEADAFPSIRAKLLTNHAETLCWYDFEAAIPAAKLALEENIKHQNRIEIGKNYVALSIANSGLRHFAKAEKYYVMAQNEFNDCHYAAGELFQLSARLAFHIAKNDHECSTQVAEQMRHEIDKIGTYKCYLPLIKASECFMRKDIQARSTALHIWSVLDNFR